MSITSPPSHPFETRVVHAPPGLVGVIGVRVLDNVGGVVVARHTSSITEDPAGSGSYVTTMTAPMTAGQYTILWDSDPGGVATQSNSAWEYLVVQGSADVVVIPGGPIDDLQLVGPCQYWLDESDLEACGVTAGDHSQQIAAASEILFELSGRQFPGVCTRSVRPCRDRCGCGIGGGGFFGPVQFGSYWAWNGSAWDNGCGDRCGCGVTSRVDLGKWPVVAVTQVTVDGVVIDPATYRLERRRYLARIGSAWPLCQDMGVPPGAYGSFVVAYTWGTNPPSTGRIAAVELAKELVAACSGDECELPSGVTQVVRQGVTYQRAVAAMIRETKTSGLTLVDSFLAAYNPRGLRRRPRFWSPDEAANPRRI
jgi:hypothetical protein